MSSDTKTRLMDAAEVLFYNKGIDATSTRNVAEAAVTNNAAPNFHFGSKSNLVKAVFERRMIPLDKRRLELAREFAEKGTLNQVESLIDVFLVPMFELLDSGDTGKKAFLGLLCRSTVTPIPEIEEVLSESLSEYNRLYYTAFAEALPNHNIDEIKMRIDFMIGAAAHALSDANRKKMLDLPESAMSTEYAYSTLKRFLVAGFKVPAE